MNLKKWQKTSIFVVFAIIMIAGYNNCQGETHVLFGSTKGTEVLNPMNPIAVRLSENTVGVGPVSSLSLCIAKARFVPTDSSSATVQVDLNAGALSVSSNGNPLGHVSIPAQSYARVELDTGSGCSTSVAVTNGSGSFSSTEPITLKFINSFEVSSTTSTIQLIPTNFIQNLANVTSNTAVKPTVDAAQGSVSVFATIPAIGWWKFDEGTGGIAGDSSGSGLNGALINGPLWVVGKMGSALSFDGVASYVDLGNPNNLNFATNSFSYSLWVYVSSSVGFYDMPFSKGGWTAGVNGYDMELGTGAWYAKICDGPNSKGATFGNETLNQWVFLSVVVDRSANQLRAYTNGALIESTDITGFGSVSGVAPAAIGYDGSTANFFKGIIDDVRIFDRALTPAEVQILYGEGI